MQRASAAEWAKRIDRWKDSELTAKEFAAEMGYKASTLSYWSSKLGAGSRRLRNPGDKKRRAKSSSREESMSPALVELPIAEIVSAPMLELVLQGDVRVRIPIEFDEDTLARLLRVVGEAS